MSGLPGWITKVTNRALYDIHVPLRNDELAKAHQDAGLSVLHSDYILPVDWSMLGLGHIGPRWLRWPALGTAIAITGPIWALEERGLGLRPNSFTSPYIFCVAELPA